MIILPLCTSIMRRRNTYYHQMYPNDDNEYIIPIWLKYPVSSRYYKTYLGMLASWWSNCILHSSYNSHLSVLGVKKARQSRDRRRQNVNRVLEANVQRQQSNRFVLIYSTVIPLISRKFSILAKKDSTLSLQSSRKRRTPTQ